jgi:hypothetical protein
MDNSLANLNISKDEQLFPGTKFIATDNNTYIFLGYSADMNNLICIKDDNLYNGQNVLNLTHDDIKQIIFLSKPIENKKNKNFIFA